MAVGDRYATLGGDRRKVRLAVLVPFFLDKLIKVSEVIHQLGWYSLERRCQIYTTTVVDVCASLTFR